MADLSLPARTVLGSVFGWGAVLTYQMIESVPSPEMQEALDELVAAGALIREQGLDDMTRTAIRYRVADGVDLAPYQKEAAISVFNGHAPSIRVFVKKDSRP